MTKMTTMEAAPYTDQDAAVSALRSQLHDTVRAASDLLRATGRIPRDVEVRSLTVTSKGERLTCEYTCRMDV